VFSAQVAAAGHQTTGEFWEVYTTGPESGSDPKQWRTELNLVLR
jgi:effector-binding domain-containing protein